MKTLNKSILSLLVSSLFLTSCGASIKNSKTETVKIYGNCGMCEEKIESAIYVKKEASGDWDKTTQMATITYDSVKTSLDDILKRVAYVGYDSDQYLAPDEVYTNLHECCQYDRPKKGNTPPVDGTVLVTPTDAVINVDGTSKDDAVVAEHATEVNIMKDVFANYFDIKDALTKDLNKIATVEANTMIDAIFKVSTTKMTSEQKSVWLKVMSDLKSNAQKIVDAKDIQTQRIYFAELSKGIYELTKVFKGEDPIYYMHCPMFNDGKGSVWLSEESVIKNPYYGSQMLTCGSLKETIK